MATATYTYTAFNRVPESDLIRIGYRPKDFLEQNHVQGPFQKICAALMPVILTRVYYKEYLLRYGPYPILRVSTQFPKWALRQKAHWLLPWIAAGVSIWWAELAYNRVVLGLRGAEPLPDQILKKKVIYH